MKETRMFLWNKPSGKSCLATLLMAHGSGSPMDSPFLEKFSRVAADSGLAVVRFEFPFMAQRRIDGSKRPPPKVETMVEFQVEMCHALLKKSSGPILIGGKSMGARIAVMAAATGRLDERILGVYCIGYPLHPVKKPSELRITPLKNCNLPCLIIQGERDPFGTKSEMMELNLPDSIQIHFISDGDHDLKPTSKSPASHDDNILHAVQAVEGFARQFIE